MKLSEDLKKWRAERPDEWTMDRFINTAERLEKALDETLPHYDMYLEANNASYEQFHKYERLLK